MACVPHIVFEADTFEEGLFADYTCETVREMDITNKRFFLQVGISEYHPIDDIYTEMRYMRAADISLRVVDVPVTAQGNEPTDAGKFTPRRAVFNDPWKIVPDPTGPLLKVTGEQISDVGTSGSALIDFSYQDPSVSVAVEYSPVDAEIIEVNNATIALIEATVNKMFDRLDLNPAKPNTYADNADYIIGTDWRLDKTDNGNGTFTIQAS